MSRDLTSDCVMALAECDLRPVIFFEGAFASGPVRLWSGLGEIGWAGQSWSGAGALLGPQHRDIANREPGIDHLDDIWPVA